MKKKGSFLLIAIFLAPIFLLLSGCAAPKLYSVNMRYDAAQTAAPAYLQAEGKTRDALIVIAQFSDRRKIDDQKIIGRVVERDGANIKVFPQYALPEQAVTEGVKSYLRKAGYRVDDRSPQWDLQKKTMPKEAAKLLIGGSIDEMEIVCRRGIPTNSYIANIRLTIVFADISGGHIAYTRRVEATASKEHISFSEERMGDYMSSVLSAAIRNAFDDKAVAKKIKELTAQ